MYTGLCLLETCFSNNWLPWTPASHHTRGQWSQQPHTRQTETNCGLSVSPALSASSGLAPATEVLCNKLTSCSRGTQSTVWHTLALFSLHKSNHDLIKSFLTADMSPQLISLHSKGLTTTWTLTEQYTAQQTADRENEGTGLGRAVATYCSL